MERKTARETDGQVLHSKNADTLIHTQTCYAETGDEKEKNRKI